MRNNIDKLINRVLEEEIQKKVENFLSEEKDEWMEIDGTVNEMDIDEEYVDEDENTESKEFVYAAKKAKEQGKKTFELDGKKFDVKEKIEKLHTSLENVSEGKLHEFKNKLMNKEQFTLKDKKLLENVESALRLKKLNKDSNKLKLTESELIDLIESIILEKKSKKWIQKTDMEKGALHKKLGIPLDKKIPVGELKKLKNDLQKKGEGDKKLSASDLKLLKQVNLALTLKNVNETPEPIKINEEQFISIVKKLVQSQINEVTDLDNMDKKTAFGLKKTQKVQQETKKENDEYAKEVVKKMREYLKDGSKGEYSMDPEQFPKGNGEMGEMSRKAYKASDAVEEYIEAFAYPGLENTNYDEIHPQEKWVKKNIVGSSETGNNPKWANAVDTELGERINKKREDNLYQKEKDRSYKRVSQPVDKAGEDSGDKKLNDIFTKLESVESKKQKLVNEEMEKMKNLITYNQKTQ